MQYEGTERVDKAPNVAPHIGITKGVIAIVLGLLWFNNLAAGGLMLYRDPAGHPGGDTSTLMISLAWGLGIAGLCIWRGVLAIKRRHCTAVTSLNLVGWIVALVGTLAYIYFAWVWSGQ